MKFVDYGSQFVVGSSKAAVRYAKHKKQSTKTVNFCVAILFFCSALFSFSSLAEPWVNTDQLWLRADIEFLAESGVIKSPINTYPLMWAAIVKDLDNTDLDALTNDSRNAYWRVKKAAREQLALAREATLGFSAANGEQVLRSFGDKRRGKAEIVATGRSMSRHYAYKAEVTHIVDPFDNDTTRYDNSYFAAIIKNWVFSIGYVEKWWGAGWDSATLLSNDARPMPQFTVQRNYADAPSKDWLNWIGPWTVTAFVGRLDDERIVNHTKSWGFALGFRPTPSWEIDLRRSGIWGGDNKANQLTTVSDIFLFSGSTCEADFANCQSDYLADSDNAGNQFYQIESQWLTGLPHLSSVYASVNGQTGDTALSAKSRFYQLGLKGNFTAFDNRFRYFVEYNQTYSHGNFNEIYETSDYPSGYRYYGQAIGSTYDNDSDVFAIGIMTQFSRHQRASLKLRHLDLNKDNDNASDNALHGVSSSGIKANQLALKWVTEFERYGTLNINLEIADKVIDSYGRQDDKYRLALGWEYGI